MEKDEKLTASSENESGDTNPTNDKSQYDSPCNSAPCCDSDCIQNLDEPIEAAKAGTEPSADDGELGVDTAREELFAGFEETALPDLSDYDESKIIRADGNYDDSDFYVQAERMSTEDKMVSLFKKGAAVFARSAFEFFEMLAMVTVVIVLCFSFIFRLNIVEGPSMEDTLHTGEYLIVSDLFYDPTPGDIIVVHDLTAGVYTDPIVKRVIATEGQTVDIDFSSWTLTVDGKVIDESSYRKIVDHLVTANVSFPVTVPENSVFVLGDNRNHSADSRIAEIGMIDERCVVGKVYARIFPFNTFKVFKNPYNN